VGVLHRASLITPHLVPPPTRDQRRDYLVPLLTRHLHHHLCSDSPAYKCEDSSDALRWELGLLNVTFINTILAKFDSCRDWAWACGSSRPGELAPKVYKLHKPQIGL
jgi:hypothetical protein